MVTGPTPNVEPGVFARLFDRGPKQLELPLDVASYRRTRLLAQAKQFATGFVPKLGASMLMKVGVPMVAATTPAVIRMIDKGWEDELVPNLLVGSALGGGWGAAVGALIPRNAAGVRISRIQSAGVGAAGGIVLAPAIALASKYVADFLTAPLERAKDDAEDRARDAEQELEQTDGGASRTTPPGLSPR